DGGGMGVNVGYPFDFASWSEDGVVTPFADGNRSFEDGPEGGPLPDGFHAFGIGDGTLSQGIRQVNHDDAFDGNAYLRIFGGACPPRCLGVESDSHPVTPGDTLVLRLWQRNNITASGD